MDPSIRFIHHPKKHEMDRVLQATAIQQKYYEKYKYSTWQCSKGKREILKEEIKNAFFLEEEYISGGIIPGSASSVMENVKKLMKLIYKQIYGFTEYKLKFIRPRKEIFYGNLKFPIFSVSSPKHSFIIDQAGCLYTDLLQFLRIHKFTLMSVCYSKILKVHDFQALLNEVKLAYHEETNASGACVEGDHVIKVCREICKSLGLTSDFALRCLYSIGISNDKFSHFPVFQVVSIAGQGSSKPNFFVDHECRVYKNWEDFLKRNVYPECLMCSPRDGTYQANLQGRVLVDIAYSPAQSNQVVTLLFKAGISAGGLIGTGTFGSVCTGIASVILIADGSNRLIDCLRHKQSTTSLEAMGCCLNVLRGVVGLGIGPLNLINGLVRGEKLPNAIEGVIKFSQLVAPTLDSSERILNIYLSMRSTKINLKGIKITSQDVKAVYSHVHTQCIKLKNVVVQLSDKVKKYLLGMWHMYFTRCENAVIAGSLSSTISAIENLDKDIDACQQEDDVFDVIEFTMMVKSEKLKKLKEKYFKEKEEVKEILRSNFRESVFDEKWGIKTGDDREAVFLNIVERTVSNEDVRLAYEKYVEEVDVQNELDSLKFRTKLAAVISYLRCFFNNDCITPVDFFDLLRRVAGDSQYIVKIETCELRKYATFYDKNVPLIVRILLAGRKYLLISAEFEDLCNGNNSN